MLKKKTAASPKKASSGDGNKTPRRMSKDPVRSQIKRNEILEAAARAIVKNPSKGHTLDEISSMIGSTRGKIYYYFKSRGDMLYQLQMYGYELVGASLVGIYENPNLTPRERLMLVIEHHTRVICEHWQIWRALWTDIALREAETGRVRIIARNRKKYENTFAQLIDAVCRTEGYKCFDTKVAARITINTINSIGRWYKSNGPVKADDIADYIVKSTFNGIFTE